jgi:hypothetical protein
MRVIIFCILACLQCFGFCLGNIVGKSPQEPVFNTGVNVNSKSNITPIDKNRSHGFLFSINTGTFSVRSLDAGYPPEPSYSAKARGYGFGAKVGYFLNANFIIGIEFNNMTANYKSWSWFSDIVASKIKYSFLQSGVYIIYSSSFPGLHYKLALKQIRLSTDKWDNDFPLQNFTGAFYMPGIELAIGHGYSISERASVFGEFAFGYLLSKNKNADISGVTDSYSYPYNIMYLGLKIGVLFKLGGKSLK